MTDDRVREVEELRARFDPDNGTFAGYLYADRNLYDLEDALTGLRFGDGVEYAPVVYMDEADAYAAAVEQAVIARLGNLGRVTTLCDVEPDRQKPRMVGRLPRALTRSRTPGTPGRSTAETYGVDPETFAAVLDNVRALLAPVEVEAARTHCLICGNRIPWWGIPYVSRLLWPVEYQGLPYHAGCIDEEAP